MAQQKIAEDLAEGTRESIQDSFDKPRHDKEGKYPEAVVGLAKPQYVEVKKYNAGTRTLEVLTDPENPQIKYWQPLGTSWIRNADAVAQENKPEKPPEENDSAPLLHIFRGIFQKVHDNYLYRNGLEMKVKRSADRYFFDLAQSSITNFQSGEIAPEEKKAVNGATVYEKLKDRPRLETFGESEELKPVIQGEEEIISVNVRDAQVVQVYTKAVSNPSDPWILVNGLEIRIFEEKVEIAGFTQGDGYRYKVSVLFLM